MKKLRIIFIVSLILLLAAGGLCSCVAGTNIDESAQDDLFEISRELIEILWDVDYRSFSPDATTQFAEKYYTEDFLENYLTDPEYYSGVESVHNEQLISCVKSIVDGRTQQQTLETGIYTVQYLEVTVSIENYQPQDADMAFFEAGKSFNLIYEIYFTEEGKIALFGFEPKDEALLPAKHKQRLTVEEQQELEERAYAYLQTRYELDYYTFDASVQWDYYEKNLSESFLERDGITKEFLHTLGKELAAYHACVQLKACDIVVGEQKTVVYDEQDTQFYYWAEAVYTISVQADQEYYERYDLTQTQTITERIYFDRKNNGAFQIVWAQFANSQV